MADQTSVLESIVSFFVPVHPDGHKFVAIAALITVAILFFFGLNTLGWLGVIATAYVAYFFRDPERVVPMREGLVVAPADGKISSVETVIPPMELGLGEDRRVRVSIFLSVFDVHINRAPVAGRVAKIIYSPGLFVNAAADKASEDNERNSVILEMPDGQNIAVVQIAGLIARRIVTFVREGDRIGKGERFGLIRFGSRVDVYLPVGKTALVAVGQRAVGGETVIADLLSQETGREYRRI